MDIARLHTDARRLVEHSAIMPLVSTRRISPAAQAALDAADPAAWFPRARHPEAALAAIWLRLGGWEQAHSIAQDLDSPEGCYWHAIVHRQEPDAWNAGYWFRRTGLHPIFPALLARAAGIAAEAGVAFARQSAWDPFAFVDLCRESAEQPGSAEYRAAAGIQEAEWWLLFEWCAHATMER